MQAEMSQQVMQQMQQRVTELESALQQTQKKE